MYQDQERVYTIRTLACDICERYDSILLTKSQLTDLVARNSLQIGSRILSHNDHLRIVYFDIDANYLGDTMSLNVSNPQITTEETDNIPFLIKKSSITRNLIHRKMLKFFTSQHLSISIVGPSMAGKTSLTLFLGTGIPERESQRLNHAATMGKSTKHFKLANNQLTVFDMGGQQSFWHLWRDSVKQSDKVIFILDVAANNVDEIISALELIVNSIDAGSSLLILFNKLDLVLDGYSNSFLDPSTLFSRITIPNQINYWVVLVSIYNGIAYNYSGEQEETALSEVIIDFLER